MTERNAWEPHRLFFFAILIFGTTIRLKGLSSGLPLHTLYGESETLNILIKMLRTGDLDPGTYVYPALAYYLYLPFLYLFYWIGVFAGAFPDLNSVPDSSLIFVGRVVSALSGAASVYLAYRIGKLFSPLAGLFAMGVLASVPQHVEFSQMLRPEVPALFFVLLAQWTACKLIDTPRKQDFLLFGVFAGAAFSTKYNIGLPLLVTLIAVSVLTRNRARWTWIAGSVLCFIATFAIINPFLITHPVEIYNWGRRFDALYLPADDYYGKPNVTYYIEFLIRYNYNVPLVLFSGIGLLYSFMRGPSRAIALAVYPVVALIWLSSFEIRRTHGLLVLHPYIALWAAFILERIWRWTLQVSHAAIFKVAYALLSILVLFWPFYRACVQTYLLGRIDNRSKAELWMTQQLPPGSRIAVLQFHQVEVDESYFNVRKFAPREYVTPDHNFEWFRNQGFDFVVVSSGQYMRYFVEGSAAEKYRQYFLQLFQDGEEHGTLVMDLVTHPTQIPDHRIKIFSTAKTAEAPAFVPALPPASGEQEFSLSGSGTILPLDPGYYTLALPPEKTNAYTLNVRNLKLNETILKLPAAAASGQEVSNLFAFSIFPVAENSRFSLFGRSHEGLTTQQPVQFKWNGLDGLQITRKQPSLEIVSMDFLAQQKEARKPYVLLEKNTPFQMKCTLSNQSNSNISGYVEAFLSQVGEPQPWKAYERASGIQDFFLEGGQTITIEIPMNTENLTGDFELSYWIFTRPRDLPYSPQLGGRFNRTIRVNDPKLGIHPIYGIPIP